MFDIRCGFAPRAAATKELADQTKPDARRQDHPAPSRPHLDALAAETGQMRAGLLLVGAEQLLRDGT